MAEISDFEAYTASFKESKLKTDANHSADADNSTDENSSNLKLQHSNQKSTHQSSAQDPANGKDALNSGQLLSPSQGPSGTTNNPDPATAHSEDESDPQVRRDVKRLIQIPKSKLSSEVNVIAADRYQRRNKKIDPDKKFQDFSIVLRTILTFQGIITESRLEIQSKRLCNLIGEIAKPLWRQVNLTAVPIVFNKPFKNLFFILKPLEARYKQGIDDAYLREEVETLLSFIKSGEGLKGLLKAHEEEVGSGKISFGMLWTLFPPETMIYSTDGEDEQCAVVESAEYAGTAEALGPLHLRIVHSDYGPSGYMLTRAFKTIKPFSGLALINNEDLGIVPLDFLPHCQRQETQERLIKRGETYLALQTALCSHLAYKGPFWPMNTKDLLHGDDKDKYIEITGRVVVDSGVLPRLKIENWQPPEFAFKNLEKFYTDRKVEKDKAKDRSYDRDRYNYRYLRDLDTASYDGDHPNDDDDDKNVITSGTEIQALDNNLLQAKELETDRITLTDDECLICPPVIMCFFLDEQQWGRVLLKGLDEIVWNAEAFEKLQMRSEQKDTIRSLVTSFDPSQEVDFDDIIQYKGRGLVFLLHGKPGLGKTFTAESIAETARLPLYHVMTGQLGTYASKVEEELRTVFEVGHRWKAVVLIDEADVLMAQRTADDLYRNAVVAVFLRLIEYYRGLLFLTTNRKDGLDTAFFNRIHVKVQFPELDTGARANIWRNLLIKSNLHQDDDLPDDVFYILSQLEINGRDIRNIIRIAHGLGQATKKDSKAAMKRLMSAIRINASEDSAERKKQIVQVEQGLMTLIELPKAPDLGATKPESADVASSDEDWEDTGKDDLRD